MLCLLPLGHPCVHTHVYLLQTRSPLIQHFLLISSRWINIFYWLHATIPTDSSSYEPGRYSSPQTSGRIVVFSLSLFEGRSCPQTCRITAKANACIQVTDNICGFLSAQTRR